MNEIWEEAQNCFKPSVDILNNWQLLMISALYENNSAILSIIDNSFIESVFV